MNDSGIYQIRNALNNKIYIGSAYHFKNRWKLHRSELRRNKHHSPHLQAAWNKYGESAFKFERLLLCSKENLLFYEQLVMDRFVPEYNHARNAARPMLGRKHTPEALAKMSAVHKGVPFTDEHKAKISAANKGKAPPVWNAESRAKLSRTLKGHPNYLKGHTEETKRKISEAQKGIVRSPMTDAHRANIRAARLAYIERQKEQQCPSYKHSPETLAKMSIGRRGKLHSPEAKLKMSMARKAYCERMKACVSASQATLDM